MRQNEKTDEIIKEPMKRVGIYMPESTYELAKTNYQSAGCKGISDYVCKAIHYYAELHSLKDCSHVVPDIITSTLKDIVRESDNRQGRLLFKMAVELTILQNIVAASNNIDAATLERVRGICVNEVKKLNGIISFDEAVRWQS